VDAPEISQNVVVKGKFFFFCVCVCVCVCKRENQHIYVCVYVCMYVCMYNDCESYIFCVFVHVIICIYTVHVCITIVKATFFVCLCM
jgi:hypothetical protein